ncbi:MAG: hypothetical protein HY751_01080 [Nitrospinae bacterium]|nr:hypothetical protein [Nitrospinota bacterium]
MKAKLIAGVVISFFMVVGYAALASAKNPQYTGNTGCKCHKQEQDEWAKSPHGKAFEALIASKRSKSQNLAMKNAKLDYKKDYDKDDKCLKCHTVGYSSPGGYEDDKSAADLKNVGCEMCHGAGSEYRNLHKEKEETFTRTEAKAGGATYGSEDKGVCLKCHDHKDSPFNSKTDKKYAFSHSEMIKLEKAWHKIYPIKFKH